LLFLYYNSDIWQIYIIIPHSGFARGGSLFIMRRKLALILWYFSCWSAGGAGLSNLLVLSPVHCIRRQFRNRTALWRRPLIRLCQRSDLLGDVRRIDVLLMFRCDKMILKGLCLTLDVGTSSQSVWGSK